MFVATLDTADLPSRNYAVATQQKAIIVSIDRREDRELSTVSPRGTATAILSEKMTLRPEPFIPASANMRELTLVPLILGTVLGIVFGASSLYLVLKVGLTVSASIPVAVISLTVFRLISKMGGRDVRPS